MKVIKRDGSTVDFDRSKIVVAIQKANNAVDESERIAEDRIENIAHYVESRNRMRLLVEDIQDMVEHQLMQEGKFDLAKAYIIYRYTRALVRKANTTDESILSLIRNSNKDVMEENSNKNAVMASTQRDLIAGEVSKDLTRRIILPEEISKAHDEGAIHFHDADYFIQPIFNCCLINIGDMLDNGTVMNGKLIESPKSFQVACTVMTQIIASVASSQYGGQSVDIRHLGKYLRRSYNKFKKAVLDEVGDSLPAETVERLVQARLKSELQSGVQTIQYQINTLMTTNGQSPFVTIFLNLQEDDEYLKENAMIVEEILRQRLQGIKNDKGVYVTPAFGLPLNAALNACIRITFPPRKCAKTTKATCSRRWAAAVSLLRGRTKMATTNLKAASIRALFPSTCRRWQLSPRATSRSSGSFWMKGLSFATRL